MRHRRRSLRRRYGHTRSLVRTSPDPGRAGMYHYGPKPGSPVDISHGARAFGDTGKHL